MFALQANPSARFSRLHSQEESRWRARSGGQTRVLFQSASVHRLWAYPAALSQRHRTIFTFLRHCRGGIRVVAHFWHDYPTRLPARHRDGYTEECLSVAESIVCPVEHLPQSGAPATTAKHGRHWLGCCLEASAAFAAIAVDIQDASTAVWATALCGLSGPIATITSLIRVSRRSVDFSGSFPISHRLC